MLGKQRSVRHAVLGRERLLRFCRVRPCLNCRPPLPRRLVLPHQTAGSPPPSSAGLLSARMSASGLQGRQRLCSFQSLLLLCPELILPLQRPPPQSRLSSSITAHLPVCRHHSHTPASGSSELLQMSPACLITKFASTMSLDPHHERAVVPSEWSEVEAPPSQHRHVHSLSLSPHPSPLHTHSHPDTLMLTRSHPDILPSLAEPSTGDWGLVLLPETISWTEHERILLKICP